MNEFMEHMIDHMDKYLILSVVIIVILLNTLPAVHSLWGAIPFLISLLCLFIQVAKLIIKMMKNN